VGAEHNGGPHAAVAELLIGPRGIVKAIHVYWPAVLYLTASGRTTGPGRLLALFAAAACWSQAAILSNDLADRRADAAAGKRRWITRLPDRAAHALVGGLVAGGLVVNLAVGAGAAAVAAYAGAVTLALAYSLQPLRLKGRGTWGPVAYSGSACLTYAVLPWAWLGGPPGLLALACAAVFADKWVNLHFHQVLDLEADRAAGARTLAVSAGPWRARRGLRWAAFLASLLMLGGAVASCLVSGSWTWAVGASAALAVGGMALHVARAPKELGRSSLLRELPSHYLALTLALFRAVPAVLLLRLCLRQPRLAGVAALFGLLLVIEARHLAGYRR
jgi:4-hydroxybenzoate polyprenyltransferase